MKILYKNGMRLIHNGDVYSIGIPMGISHDDCNSGYCVYIKNCWYLQYNDIVIAEFRHLESAKKILLDLYTDNIDKMEIIEDAEIKYCGKYSIVRTNGDRCDKIIKDICERVDRGEITDIDKFLDKIRKYSGSDHFDYKILNF